MRGPMTRRLLACAVLLLSLAARAAPTTQLAPAHAPDDGNGRLGFVFGGEGGDPVEGGKLFAQHCAVCHDHPTGRIPARAALADDTRTYIATTLFVGVMRPMAKGLSPLQVKSIAAYLSKRVAGVAGDTGPEAPRCDGAPPPLALSAPEQWNGWGRTAEQSRYQPDPGLAAADVPRLKLKWAFAYASSRNGQATVLGDRLYINASSGAVYALDARSGCAYWRYDAPAATRGSIVVGDLPGKPGRHAVYITDYSRNATALDADTGAVIWQTQVDDQHEVQMTGSLTLSDGLLFVPLASAEEAIATDPTYECCHFQGALAALDAATGRLVWRYSVTPGPAHRFATNSAGHAMYGPAGGAIWDAPTVDGKRPLVFVGTGASYTDLDLPPADALLALDERTGALRWSRQMMRADSYIVGCTEGPPAANCPTHPGPDADFGASVILQKLPDGHDILLAGQKSGEVYGLDPDSGRTVWTRRVSPGGALGGVEFGMAASPDLVFVPASDVFVPYGAEAQPGVSALRVADGSLAWQFRAPTLPCGWANPFCSPAMSQAVSAIPGAVFGASMDGRFRALDARTGAVLWQFDTAVQPVSTVSGSKATGGVMDGAGPTVAGGVVYVNSGYQGRSGRAGTVLMAFSVDGK